MTQNDKELLIKDLSSRLPYGIKVQVFGWDEEKGEVAVPLKVYSISTDDTDGYITLEYNHYDIESVYIEDCLLYLRPMSSITEEEKEEYCNLQAKFLYSSQYPVTDAYGLFDWLNAHHFDYRNLIEKNLALDCTGLHIYD